MTVKDQFVAQSLSRALVDMTSLTLFDQYVAVSSISIGNKSGLTTNSFIHK